jgi:hypothetical protein
MDKNEDKPLRYSDYWLKRYADELEYNIKVKAKYSHMTDAKEELLLELVRRELERSGTEDKQE